MGKAIAVILMLLVVAAIIYVIENNDMKTQKPDWGIAKDSPIRK